MYKKNNNRVSIEETLVLLEDVTKNVPHPLSVLLQQDYGNDPFLMLIACLLSLRARDTVTYPVCKKLFAVAKTPQEFGALSLAELESIIHSLGFYHRKAQVVKSVCKELIERFNEKVPATRRELLSLPGVGPKTANLVLAESFNIPAICVDTHVHHLANAFGWVATTTVHDTEKALELLVPKKRWRDLNRLLVTFGQNKKKIFKEITPEKALLLSPVYSVIRKN